MNENSNNLASPRALMEQDYFALASFRYALRLFLAFSEQAAKNAGLPPQQHQAILAIRGFSSGGRGLSVGELAERLLLKHHTAVELVNRLVKAGLVVRSSDDQDRRFVYLSLTPKAEETLAHLLAQHLAEIQRNAPELIHVLEKIRTPAPAGGATS